MSHGIELFGTPDYWYRKGLSIARVTVEKFKDQGALDHRIILPADKKSVGASTFDEMLHRANNPRPEDIFVDRTQPVVRGYLEGMQVEDIVELKYSPLLAGLEIEIVADPIFRGDQYRPEEMANLRYLYLPAIAIEFLPTSTQLSFPDSVI